MKELFSKIFAGKGLSDDEIERYASEFAGIVFLAILGASGDRLTDEDKKRLEELLNSNNASGALELLRSKHSEEEWNRILEAEVDPLLDSYIKEVLPKERGTE